LVTPSSVRKGERIGSAINEELGAVSATGRRLSKSRDQSLVLAAFISLPASSLIPH